VLGSIASASYRSAIDLGGVALPPPVQEAARESVGAATGIAASVPGGPELANRAGEAYTHAFNVTSRVAVALALAAAIVVATVFRRRAEQEAVAAEDPDEKWALAMAAE
jgi:DHA2 family integral membrane protein (MFS transporter)